MAEDMQIPESDAELDAAIATALEKVRAINPELAAQFDVKAQEDQRQSQASAFNQGISNAMGSIAFLPFSMAGAGGPVPFGEGAATAADLGVQYSPDIAAGAAATAVTGATGNPALGVGAAALVGGVSRTIRDALQGKELDPAAVAEEAGVQGVAETIGWGAPKILGKAANKLAGRLLPGAVEHIKFLGSMVDDIAPILAKDGWTAEEIKALREAPVLPADVTIGKTFDFLQNLAENAVFGTSSIQVRRSMQETLFNESAEILMNRLGGRVSDEAMSELLSTGIKSAQAAARANQSAYHEIVAGVMATDDIMGEVMSSAPAGFGLTRPTFSPVRSAMKVRLTGNQKGLVNLEGVEGALKGLARYEAEFGRALDPEGVSRLLNDARILSAKKKASFDDVRRLRSRLDKVISGASSPTNPKPEYLGQATKLRASLTKRMESALDEFDTELRRQGKLAADAPGALGIWREAGEATKEYYNGIGHTFFRQIIDQIDQAGDGVAAVKRVVGNRDSAGIRELRSFLGEDSPAWKTLQSWKTQELLFAPTQKNTAALSGDAFLRQLSTFGDDAGKELYGEAGWEGLKEFGKALSFAQKKNKSFGSMAVQVLQSGAILSVPTAVVAGSEKMWQKAIRNSAGFFLTASGIAKVMSDPRTLRAVTTGTRFGPKSQAWSRAMARVVANTGQGDIFEIPQSMPASMYRELGSIARGKTPTTAKAMGASR